MKAPIPFELEDGTVIYIEAEETGRSQGMQRVGRGGDKDEKAAKRFSDAIAHIRPAAEAVLNSFREMNTPDEIGLEFSAKPGTAIIASADGKATFKVNLK